MDGILVVDATTIHATNAHIVMCWCMYVRTKIKKRTEKPNQNKTRTTMSGTKTRVKVLYQHVIE